MTRILFVCHGNICRSVGAQYILQDMVNQKHIAGHFLVDSSATSDEEIGNPIYPPMKRALEDRHIPVGNHQAKQLRKADYAKYDLIIGMDEENLRVMQRIFGGDPDGKLHYLLEYTGQPDRMIADPWYTRKFDRCVEEIAEGCAGLLQKVMRGHCLRPDA